MKVGILYGWAEGRWHAKRFAAVLKTHGIQLTEDVTSAEVIICHSGGCYMLPKNQAKLILMIGPPYWPNKSMGARGVKKTYQDFREHHSTRELKFWFNKTAHNTYYMVFHLPKWVRMHRNWRSGAFPEKLAGQRIVVVRNRQDIFCKLSAIKNLAAERGWEFKELPGVHDDIWIHPERYLPLIQK